MVVGISKHSQFQYANNSNELCAVLCCVVMIMYLYQSQYIQFVCVCVARNWILNLHHFTLLITLVIICSYMKSVSILPINIINNSHHKWARLSLYIQPAQYTACRPQKYRVWAVYWHWRWRLVMVIWERLEYNINRWKFVNCCGIGRDMVHMCWNMFTL